MIFSQHTLESGLHFNDSHSQSFFIIIVENRRTFWDNTAIKRAAVKHNLQGI